MVPCSSSPTDGSYRLFSEVDEGEIYKAYDVFLSYRWNNYDSDFTGKLYDRLKMHLLGSDQTVTFLDHKRLNEGDAVREDFFSALLSSTVAAPVISHLALERLITNTPDVETAVDNLLLEWLCMVITMTSGRNILSGKNYKLSKVMPILIGKRSIENSLTKVNAFSLKDLDESSFGVQRSLVRETDKRNPMLSEGRVSSSCFCYPTSEEKTNKKTILDLLPEIIPVATINRAKQLFENVSFISSTRVSNKSVIYNLLNISVV